MTDIVNLLQLAATINLTLVALGAAQKYTVSLLERVFNIERFLEKAYFNYQHTTVELPASIRGLYNSDKRIEVIKIGEMRVDFKEYSEILIHDIEVFEGKVNECKKQSRSYIYSKCAIKCFPSFSLWLFIYSVIALLLAAIYSGYENFVHVFWSCFVAFTFLYLLIGWLFSSAIERFILKIEKSKFLENHAVKTNKQKEEDIWGLIVNKFKEKSANLLCCLIKYSSLSHCIYFLLFFLFMSFLFAFSLYDSTSPPFPFDSVNTHWRRFVIISAFIPFFNLFFHMLKLKFLFFRAKKEIRQNNILILNGLSSSYEKRYNNIETFCKVCTDFSEIAPILTEEKSQLNPNPIPSKKHAPRRSETLSDIRKKKKI